MSQRTHESIAPRYTMQIAWSDEDGAYLVSFPEWAEYVPQPVTHGASYEEAARKGDAVLQNLIATAQQEGVPLPPVPVQVA